MQGKETKKVTKERLKQYRPMRKELLLIDRKLDALYDARANVSTIPGKVKASDTEFPYTEFRVSVPMEDPVRAAKIKQLIAIREKRRAEVVEVLTEVERFIASIPDSEARQAYELVYMDGKTQEEVGEILCLDRSRVSRKISRYLKNAHKAQK